MTEKFRPDEAEHFKAPPSDIYGEFYVGEKSVVSNYIERDGKMYQQYPRQDQSPFGGFTDRIISLNDKDGGAVYLTNDISQGPLIPEDRVIDQMEKHMLSADRVLPKGVEGVEVQGFTFPLPRTDGREKVNASGLTQKQERGMAAINEQIQAASAVEGSVFTLPKDSYGIEDKAREERVIVDFNPAEYRKEI